MIFSCFEDGNTSAHIAAKRGSSRVLQELLKFDKNIVTTSRLLFWHFIQVGSPSPSPSASPLTKVPAPRISGSSPRGRPGTPSGTFYTDDEDENDDDHHYTGDNLLIRDDIRLWWKWFLPQSWVPLLCSIWCGVSWNFYQKMTGSLVIYIVGSTKRPMRLG